MARRSGGIWGLLGAAAALALALAGPVAVSANDDPTKVSLVSVQIIPNASNIKSGLAQTYLLYATFDMSDGSSITEDVTAAGAVFAESGVGKLVGTYLNTYQSVQRQPETTSIVGSYTYNGVTRSATARLKVYR